MRGFESESVNLSIIVMLFSTMKKLRIRICNHPREKLQLALLLGQEETRV
jgi:hypothetical protein